MIELPQTTEQPPVSAPRRVYAPPQLTVHGTVQALTQDTTGVDGASGVDDA
jgi:hypothetical protein